MENLITNLKNANITKLPNKSHHKSKTSDIPNIALMVGSILWLLFSCSLGLLIYYQINTSQFNFGELIRINGFTLLIWVMVTFFSAIVGTYSNHYLRGFTYQRHFALYSLGFTFSVILFVMSNHIVLFLGSWGIMGFFMARLIGVNKSWGEALEASRFAQKFFLAGTLLLSIGIVTLSFITGSFTITGIINSLALVPKTLLLASSLCIIGAAIIQSAIYPFHKWLLSAMTTPTPASALMHAGFVNGAGILLALLSTIMIDSNSLTLLFIIGGLTAVIAQFTKLLQTNIKQKLAFSTIAQMGFMIMQCGLGFSNAAVAHLILHGFYKAYLFLSSGEEVVYSVPQMRQKIKISLLQVPFVLIFGLAGALLFAFLTGKTSFTDSSIFLILIVAITVGQMAYNIVKEKSLTNIQKFVLPIGLFIVGIGMYALLYNWVTSLMTALPNVAVPQSLSVLQVVFGVLFLIGFFVMKLGVYRKIPWLYVKLLNLSQPYKKTVLNYKKITQ